MRFADPKNDLAFKKIFGDENHKDILMSFLNSVLDFKNDKEITEVELTNPYQLPDIKELKETILDIKATNKSGETFIVEMQKKDLGDFSKRSLYYTSKAYVQQLPKGENYSILKKVYYIAIVDFEIFENKSYISRHLIINQETLKQDLKDFEFTFVELPKFKKDLNSLNSVIDKWIYFLKNAGDLEIIPKELKENPFPKAFDIVMQTAWSKDEMEVYDYMNIKAYDEINAMETAKRKAREAGLREGKEAGLKKGKEEGLKKGKEQGLAEGKEQGLAEGKEQGLAEGEKKAKMEIARNLLKVGVDVKTVSLSTGLSEEEIGSII